MGSEVPEPTTATPGERLTLSGEPVTGAPGDSRGIKFSFYPIKGGDVSPSLNCTEITPDFTVSKKTVTAGTPMKWTAIVKIPSGISKGQYLCSLTVGDISEDVRIIVT